MSVATRNFGELSTQILLRHYVVVVILIILLLGLGYVMTLEQQERLADDLRLFNWVAQQRPESSHSQEIELTVTDYQAIFKQRNIAYNWARFSLLNAMIAFLLLDALVIFRATFHKLQQAFALAEQTQQQLQQKITELAQADETYRLLVNNSLQGLTIIQGERICFVNQPLLTLLGYESPADLLALSATFNAGPPCPCLPPRYIGATTAR
jgi:PAS domain-containing protein